jgi:hypothetical protein
LRERGGVRGVRIESPAILRDNHPYSNLPPSRGRAKAAFPDGYYLIGFIPMAKSP